MENESLALGRKIVDILVDKMGEDILLLDIGELTTVAECFVICSGSSERQLGALVESVRVTLKHEMSRMPLRIEGKSSSGWILIDYGGVVVHVFTPEMRVFYDLEGLWRDGRVLVRLK